MKQSSKCALGGIVAALSAAMMILVAVIPFLTYALPAVAGALIVFIVIEIDKKWAFGVYAVVSVLALLLVPDKEVAVMYVAFFGYYPILKAAAEARCGAALSWVIKIAVFLGSMMLAYVLMINLMGVTIDEMEDFGVWAVPLLLGIGTVAFILYDVVLTKLVTLYLMKFRKYFRRYFK
ncbi:MAG: hypothetical protein IKD72_05045 [Clostridia bacterium]|nr:hypothetical protein [Clostridia bacterium]